MINLSKYFKNYENQRLTTNYEYEGPVSNAAGGNSGIYTVDYKDIPLTTIRELMINGNTNICSNTTNNYSVLSQIGATSYTWTLPSGWSGSSSTTSISTVSNTSGGYITVNNPAYKVLTVKGADSQSANLLEFQNSAGTVLSNIDSNGYLGLGNNYNSPSTSGRSSGTKIVLYPSAGQMDYGIGVESLFSWYSSPGGAGHKFYVNNNATSALTINSTADSNVNCTGGTKRTASSVPEALTLVSCLPLMGFTTKSLSLE